MPISASFIDVSSMEGLGSSIVLMVPVKANIFDCKVISVMTSNVSLIFLNLNSL